MNALLVICVVLPGLAGLVCVLLPPARPLACRLSATATALAFALAVVVLGAVIVSGPVSLVTAGAGGRAAVGVFVDRLGAVMLLLVLGVSTVVQAFTSRYLSGDPSARRLIAACGLTTTAVAGVVSAATLSGLIVAWLLTGVGLVAMLAQRADLAAAKLGVRRVVLAFAAGDVALVLAGVVAFTTVGDLDLRHVGEDAGRLSGAHFPVLGISVGAGALMACLLVVAAVGRSAQLPLQNWLPATLAAPTPVSAFLHAGLVNAGGFLLVRLGPVFELSSVATGLAFVVGTATALYGTALMLAKPDVKGALAHSTIGQMGFMVLACSLGAFAAAIFHLVGHGMYKATLFLGADSVVHNDKRRAVVPRPAPGGVRWSTGRRLLVAFAVPGAALTAGLLTFASAALDHPGAIVLIAFAWVTAAQAAYSWMASTAGRSVLGLLALALACLMYAALLAGANSFLAPALPPVRHPVTPWLAAAPAVLFLLALVARRRGPGWRVWTYAWVLDRGHVAARRRASGLTALPPHAARRPVASTDAPRSVTA